MALRALIAGATGLIGSFFSSSGLKVRRSPPRATMSP